MSKKLIIEIIGPESSGKSTLAKQLSEHFGGICVEEYARTFLQQKDGKYEIHDVVYMAEEQQHQIELASQRSDLVFVDTGLLNFYVWCMLKYENIPEGIIKQWVNHLPHYYLLLSPDLEWEYDPLRESPQPEDRELIFKTFKQILENNHLSFSIISGKGKMRMEQTITIIKKLF